MVTDDLTFKYVFSKKEILEDFINSFLEHLGIHDYQMIDIKSIIPEAYLMPNNKKYKSYYGDLVMENDDVIVSLEMYKNTFNKKSFNKSLGYLCRLYSNQYPKTQPDKYKKVISINLINGSYEDNNEVVNGYLMKNRVTNIKITDDISMFLVRYDLAKTSRENDRFIRYLRIIGSENESDMKKIAKGDKKMLDAIKYWMYWNKSSAKVNYELHCEELKEEGRAQGLIVNL